MATISLCLIAKNEEKRIGNCLSTFGKVADEIIVVDTGSEDKTKEIAANMGANVYDFEWINDFSAARNYSFSKATKDYILWVDADDILADENIEKILNLKKNMNKDYYTMWYDYRHDKNGKCTYSFRRDRIVKNNKGYYWDCAIHEALNVWGDYEDLDAVVTHTSNHDNGYKYIQFFEKRIEDGFKLLPREKYYYGGELFVFGQIDKCINILEDFVKDNYPGAYENKRTRDYLGRCYQYKKDYIKAAEWFLQYQLFDTISEDVAYEIGNCFYNAGRYPDALFWYETIINIDFPENKFTRTHDDHLLNSYLQASICNYYIGNLDKAEELNNKLLEKYPDNKAALHNKEFFKNYKKSINKK